MTFLLDHSPSGRSRIAALLAAVLAAAGLLLGAASAQANPSDPAPDFLMKVGAASASFTPVAGKPGEYRLVLRGVPSKVKVTELTNAKTSASLPINAFMAYWTRYGDKTGQFKTTPPRVVLQGADAAGDKKVVVRLRDASRTGTTLKFDAQVITSPAESEQLGAKIDKIDDTPQVGDPVLKPTALTDVELFVDMPSTPRIQPKTKSSVLAVSAQAPGQPGWRDCMKNKTCAPPCSRIGVGWNRGPFDCAANWRPPRMLGGGTCNGTFSNRLRLCWNVLEQAQLGQRAQVDQRRGRECTHPGRANPAQGWFYDRVGMVDLGGYFWAPAATMLNRIRERVYVPSPQGYDWGRCITYWRWGTWYGVHRDWRTFYVVNRCNWFMAAWAPNGRCW